MTKTKKTTTARKSTIDFIEKLFDELNVHFYTGELIRPEMTMQTADGKNAVGWFTRSKVWKTEGDENYELNVCPEHLDKPFFEVVDTLLHEMAHLYARQNDIQDCSRSSMYHNKHFAEIATAHGMIVTKSETYGYAFTKLNPASIDWLNKHYPGIERFDIYRTVTARGWVSGGNDGDDGRDGDGNNGGDGEGNSNSESNGGKKKSRSIKYSCPTCGAIARATKKINITCTDCQVEFIEN